MTGQDGKWLFSRLPDGEVVAWTTDPRMNGLQWWWTPGAGQVEYGFARHLPLGNVNLMDYKAGRPCIETTPEALRAYLEGYYADEECVTAVLETVAAMGPKRVPKAEHPGLF